MTEQIPEQNVDFANEPEAKKFLDRANVNAVGGIDADVISITKEKKKSKQGKEYDSYTMTVRTTHDEYVIDNLFRGDFAWGKVAAPKRVKITTEKVGQFYNYKILPL